MRHRRTTNENKMLSKMENMISMMTTEKPFERLQSLEQKINEVDKIQTIENYIAQLKERIWAVKEVLTTAEASAYLGLSESYIYKLTSLKQIPHYKPNGKLVYFNRKELCKWAMRNQVQTIGQPAAITKEEL
ncbi:helix-turn-helix domain-containing protein [Bacteroides ovatus]|nr:helix-turn-helix domain-containing protein [Bacteroides ovatus]KAA3914039.1 helix-turn-helix domain-containing protein [Bacteroides ovatus]